MGISADQGSQATRLGPIRVAEQIADVLRRRILGSDFTQGSMLPKQDEIAAEFGAGYPSVREALRILEAEGLISIRRGNQGGAQVHAPDASTAGYALGLALQALRVPLSDLAEAISALEPLSAGRCARRLDRKKVVVPALRALVEQAEQVIDDEVAFARLGRQFHEALMEFGDNATEKLIVMSLDALWFVQEEEWVGETARRGRSLDARDPESILDAHRSVIDLIDRGDSEGAVELMRTHVHSAHQRVLGESVGVTVDAASPRVRWKLGLLAKKSR